MADDHALFREGLKLVLGQRPECAVVGEAGDGLELLAMLRHGPPPDLIILDVSIPRLRGIEAIREIKAIDEKIRILVLTMHKDERLLCEAFIAGADGYVLKDGIILELVAAIYTVLSGKIYLSPAMKRELPENCRLTPLAGQALPSNTAEHPKVPDVAGGMPREFLDVFN